MTRRNKRAISFTARVTEVRAAVASDGRAVTVTRRPTPTDLPRRSRAQIVLVDVDNIVIGPGSRIDPVPAFAALDEVYRRLSGCQLSLAVVSATAARSLGAEVWFRYPHWEWRVAETGPDAADRQLMDFAGVVRTQRPRARVAVVSGDGIFADLAAGGPLDVVVPVGHRVSRRLVPYLRPAPGRGAYDLAT